MSRSASDYRSLSIPERLRLVEEIWDSIAEDTLLSLDGPQRQIARKLGIEVLEV